MTTFFKRTGFALLGVAASMIAPNGVAAAQDAGEGQALTLQDLLNEVREDQRQLSRENQERIQRFRAERDNQRRLLEEARAEAARLEARADELEAEQEANDEQLTVLNERFSQEQGQFGELFGETRRVAGETAGQLENSLISSQFPGREERLREIAGTEALPSERDLNLVWEALLEEIAYQGQVARFTAPVRDGEGVAQPTEVVRIGPFTAIDANGYLSYNADTQQLERLPKAPSGPAAAAADRLFGAQAGSGRVEAMIDPSLGSILAAQIRIPSLGERIEQGGLVGYIVLFLGAIGVVLGVVRLVMLALTNAAVRAQAKSPSDPKKGNPLGRVIMAYHEHKNEDVETMELRLDEAILRETPKLETGLNTLKVLAAVAPLMGLLGTVTGMIATFQAITLFGTGDPQLMAGGISQALVTTVEGLVVAIPLLLLHSFASTSARNVGQVLEEQAAGLVAEHAEAHKRAA